MWARALSMEKMNFVILSQDSYGGSLAMNAIRSALIFKAMLRYLMAVPYHVAATSVSFPHHTEQGTPIFGAYREKAI